jgi:hypothetical protein
MNSEGAGDPVRAYFIQHIQSGAEFRAADLSEVNQWMADQNRQYLTTMLSGTSGVEDEDAPGGGQ